MKRTAWIVVGWLVLGGAAQAASFDCEKAHTKVERIICDNPEISKLDDELAERYKSALKDKSRTASIRKSQKQWIKDRNGCADVGCIKRAYEERLLLLDSKSASADIRAEQKKATGSWTYRGLSGRNEPLCHKLLSRLNRYDRDESLGNRCSFPVLASYPNFTAPPWEELDVGKHGELFFELVKFSEEGPHGYFGWTGMKQKAPDSYYRYLAKLYIDQGARMRMWRTRLVNHYQNRTGHIVLAPPGEQVIVQIYQIMPAETQVTYCVGKPKPGSTNMFDFLIIVTPDLTGPDPNVDPGTNAIVSSRDLLIYEGKPVLVGSEDVWRDGVLRPDCLCDFEFVQGE